MQPHAPSPRPEKDVLEEMKMTGKWVALMIAISYMYGDLTVMRHITPDPRQDTWILMLSPIPTIVLCLLYVATVTWWGPSYMSTRKPVSGLRPYMMAYNVSQIILSAWIFWEAGMGGWFGSYSFVCQRCDFSNNPQALRMVGAGYWYLFSKYVDFIDTIFFLLNKKNEHISLLHVCHHALMPVSMWYGIRHYSGGHTTLTFLLNSFVHVVMYLYYLLAAMGPRVRPFLWWKKYLTTLQIVQFLVVVVQNTLAFFVECAVPSILLLWVSSMAFLFLFLFTDFYIKAYRRKSKYQKASGSRQEVVATSPGAPYPPRLKAGAATKVVSDMYRAEVLRVRARV